MNNSLKSDTKAVTPDTSTPASKQTPVKVAIGDYRKPWPVKVAIGDYRKPW